MSWRDADTLACIVGAVAEAVHGVLAEIPIAARKIWRKTCALS
jgi:ADP-ribosylglycohydrolase